MRGNRIGIAARGFAALGIALAGFVAIASARPAAAFNASTSGSNTLAGYNSQLFQFAYFPWTADSSIYYVKVQDATGGYVRVDNATHQDKTASNWPGYSMNLTGYVSTAFYGGSSYVYSWTYGSGTCLIPPWTYWFCSADNPTSFNRYYGSGRGDMDARMGIGNGGWGTYSGNQITGSFYFSF